jgi:hypothetical protein
MEKVKVQATEQDKGTIKKQPAQWESKQRHYCETVHYLFVGYLVSFEMTKFLIPNIKH